MTVSWSLNPTHQLRMQTETLTIVNKLGLHARAAAKLVNTASHYSSEITIKRDSREANAKSIMGVMMLSAAKGCELTVVVDGNDEQAALGAIKSLVTSRFGESE